MNASQLMAAGVIAVIIYGIVGFLPDILKLFRERYTVRLKITGRELNRFFIDVAPIKIVIGASVLGAVLGVLTGSWVLALALCLAGVLAPKFVLVIWKDIRSRKFDEQMMDALILLGNSLKSGLDIVAGFELISNQMKPPISEEFGLVINSYRLGAPLERALIEMTERISSRSLETVVYSINIQRESGGNIVKTFDQLVITIREESKLQKKVKAMTSQARTQIYFLAGFPWGLALLFYVMAPDFMQPALANPWGQLVLLFLVIWEVVGIFVTQKLVVVEV